MATIKACDGCGKTERETEITREYKQTGTVPDGNGGRDDDGEYVDGCHACRARAAEVALLEIAGDRWKANELFLKAFKNISRKG